MALPFEPHTPQDWLRLLTHTDPKVRPSAIRAFRGWRSDHEASPEQAAEEPTAPAGDGGNAEAEAGSVVKLCRDYLERDPAEHWDTVFTALWESEDHLGVLEPQIQRAFASRDNRRKRCVCRLYALTPRTLSVRTQGQARMARRTRRRALGHRVPAA